LNIVKSQRENKDNILLVNTLSFKNEKSENNIVILYTYIYTFGGRPVGQIDPKCGLLIGE